MALIVSNVSQANVQCGIIFQDQLRRQQESQLVALKSLVDRLGLDHELAGHEGCVNCLDWSSDGSLLSSGSDDCRVMLWDPFKRERLAEIEPGHLLNIFSVKVSCRLNWNCSLLRKNNINSVICLHYFSSCRIPRTG